MTTIELLDKLTLGKEKVCFKDPSERVYFTVSDKQFQWLWGVFSGEVMNADGKFNVSLNTDNGTYSFGWNMSRWNVPHYIKNRQKYGKTYYIAFHEKK